MSLTNTDPEHWRRVDALLTQALGLAPQARESWLETLPESDRSLAPMLRKMLARAAKPADEFMRRPASTNMLGAFADESPVEKIGAQIGPYRLIRELGTGGMGRVWLAERTDGSLQRQVALKLPRMGWARGVAERLTQERDALAALEHPNIARLYDAGTVEGGRPYIAMEYVDGVPVNDYVLSNSCSLAERLQLFEQVANAVAFAHARLIVHRDIKPQNILVTADGAAHLLDFGAAKLLGRDDEQHLTRQMGGAFSPDYASPEQIRGDRITVATDVYSLGVLLYELLTGSRPYKLQRLSGAALEEAILKADIPLASSAVTLNKKYAQQLRGDLDAIVAKALRRNPANRYASVQAFADDIARCRAGEPVLAQPQSRTYRTLKFVRRNRLAVGASAAVLLALGIGALVSLWQANLARQEAARAARVKEFVASIFTQAVPKTGVGGTVTAYDLLAAAAERVDRELADDPAVAAELAIIIGRSFDQLGYVRETEPLLRTAVKNAARVFGPEHPVTLDAKLGLENAVKYHDPAAALAILQDVMPQVIRDLPNNASRAADALMEQSFVLTKLRRRDEAYASLQEAVRIGEQYLGPLDEATIFNIGLLSNTYAAFGDRQPQLATAIEALRRAEQAFGKQRPHNTLIAVERWYADALRENDRPGDAIPILRRVVDDQMRLDGAVTMRVRNARMQLAVALVRVGAIAEALTLTREAVALEKAQNPDDSDDRRAYAENYAAVLALANRIDEAQAQHAYIETLVPKLGERPSSRIGRKIRQARLAVMQGELNAAKGFIDDAESLLTDKDLDLWVQVQQARAFVLRQAGAGAEARQLLERVLADPRFSQQRLAQQSGIEAELGLLHLDQGRADLAAAPLRHCEEHFRQAQIQPSPRVAGCMIGNARLAILQGRSAAAARDMSLLAKTWQELNPGNPLHGEALYWLAQAQMTVGPISEAKENLRRARQMLGSAKAPFLRRLGKV